MKNYLLFTLAAFMLLVLRPTPVWCAEDFEVMWEKDLSFDDFNFFYYHNELQGNKIYAVSSDMNNFIAYQIDYFTIKILELSTGNFVKNIVVDSSLWPEQKGISNIKLIDNQSKLAVTLKSGFIYIYETKNWELLRKVETKGELSNDGQLLLIAEGSAISIYDFNTMKNKLSFFIENPSGYLEKTPYVLISNDNKRAVFDRWLDGWQQVPDAYLCEVYDLETKQRLFRYTAEATSNITDVFINSDLSKLYLNSNGDVAEYDMNTGKLAAKWGICNNSNFRYKMSENEKYIFCSGSQLIWAAILNKSVQQHSWYGGLHIIGFLDAGKDYILALRNITDTSAAILKLKINIEEITPVEDNPNKIEILYPNPTNSIVHIPNIKIQNNNNIKVIDEKGSDNSKKCIVTILPDAIDINLQKLSNGVYFIQINTSTISKTYKVIKN